MADPHAAQVKALEALRGNLKSAIRGKDSVLEQLLVAVLASGRVQNDRWSAGIADVWANPADSFSYRVLFGNVAPKYGIGK